MFDVIFFVMILFSGGILCAAVKKSRFEYAFPITCMGLVMCVYVFGLLGAMKFGVLFVCILSLGGYLFAAYRIISARDYKGFLERLVSPGFLFIIILFVLLMIGDYGKMADAWDEFSHWMDSVKAMSYIDDFITNPESHSLYKSYPPAMTIFQYFFQRIHLSLNRTEEFNEWRMYLAYQIFAYSVFLPLFPKKIDIKKPMNIIVTAAGIIMLPILFYSGFLTTVYIDPFVGILCGAGFAAILMEKEKKADYIVYICLLCATIILAKDVGLFFAVFIILYFTLDGLYRKQGVKYFIFPILSVVAAKATWYMELILYNVSITFRGTNIDLIKYTKIFIRGNDETYYQQVVDNIKSAFFKPKFTMNGALFTLHTSYFMLLMLGIVLLTLLNVMFYIKDKKITVPVFAGSIISVLMVMVYAYSLGATYCSNFVPNEAIGLASYDRYMNMAYLALYLFIFAAILYYLFSLKSNQIALAAVVLCIILFTPIGTFKFFMLRLAVKQSIYDRGYYAEIAEKIINNSENGEKIFFIAEDRIGVEHLITMYNARPRYVVDTPWSLGEPFDEGDIWTSNIKPEEWMDMLVKDYSYVALYAINDYFIEHYGYLFDDTENMADNTLFAVDKGNRKLTFVE